MGVTFIIFAIITIKKMARKGDIDSKSVASRVPMEVYLRLLKNSSSNKQTLSSYLCDVLSDEKFGQGGVTEKVVYRDRIIEKKIEAPVYRDRIVEKKVEIDNPKISQENVALKKQIQLLEDEIKELKKVKTALEPTYISIARDEVKKGTADERTIKMIQELDSKK